jgi:hypothetical protein
VNPDDEAALTALIDRDSPVIRALATVHVGPDVTLELPSGETVTVRCMQRHIERITRRRLIERATRTPVRNPSLGYQAYKRAVDNYVAGTGTLDELTAEITPEVSALISADEHAAAKQEASDREAAARTAECAARNRHQHVKRVTGTVRAHPVFSSVAALIVALLTVPWVMFGFTSDAEGWGLLVSELLMLVAIATWASRA